MENYKQVDINSSNISVIEELERLRTEFNKISIIDDATVRNTRFNVIIKDLLTLFDTYTELACEFILESFHRDDRNSYFTKAYMYCLCKLISNKYKGSSPYFVIGYLMIQGYLPMKLKCLAISSKVIEPLWFLKKAYEYGDNRAVDYIEICHLFEHDEVNEFNGWDFRGMTFGSVFNKLYTKALDYLTRGHYELLLLVIKMRNYISAHDQYSYAYLKHDDMKRIVDCIVRVNYPYLTPDTQRVIRYIEDNYEHYRKKYLKKRIIGFSVIAILLVAYFVLAVYAINKGFIWQTVLIIIMTIIAYGYKESAPADKEWAEWIRMPVFYAVIYIKDAMESIFYYIPRKIIRAIVRKTFMYDIIYPVRDLPGMDKINCSDRSRDGVYVVIR